jgi:subtilisin family serine protease
MKKYFLTAFLTALLIIKIQVSAQKNTNWYNSGNNGLQTHLAYENILIKKDSKPVVVAIIDSGIDIGHEDLNGKIWVNKKEIPNNGIDDDDNGYIDDINGWNFLGNSKGENLNNTTLEVARIFSILKPVFENINPENISENQRNKYELYIEVKNKLEKNIEEVNKEVSYFKSFYNAVYIADESLKNNIGPNYTIKDLKNINKKDSIFSSSKMILRLNKYGYSLEKIENDMKYFQDQLDYNYNYKLNLRADIIGDDLSDINDITYGNNQVQGPDANHGTHCAGIIGANRNNDIGNMGVADNVQLMSLRAVPNGDEWDKDIALAIRYAVNNGAKVINMSFGKDYSPEKKMVINAIRYAEANDVLLVHAAGNESSNNDSILNFPTPKYPSMNNSFSNWIEVGASTRFNKAKLKKGYIINDGLAADFSNYGHQFVDVFAPGHDIYSTIPDNKYEFSSGTSMAAPMVSGLAALLKSYYPKLTMLEIKEIIIKSSKKYTDFITSLPGEPLKQISFEKLSSSGGIANVYNAVIMAEKIFK